MLNYSHLEPGNGQKAGFTVRHNCVGTPYSVKLVYPNFYSEIDLEEKAFKVGFPRSKRKMASKVESGHLFFIYVTAPEKWIIGLGRVLGGVKEDKNQGTGRPYQAEVEWVIGPKNVGVRFLDVDLFVKPRIGDSLYALDNKSALRIIERLRQLPDATEDDLKKKAGLYQKAAGS